MPKYQGLVRLKGKIGDLLFYTSRGKNVVKMAGEIDKERIEKDPAYKRTRENMAEFGASATIGKSFRKGFAAFNSRFGDDFFIGRVVAMIRRIIGEGAGQRGQRSFDITAHADMVVNFEFNKADTLDSFMNAPFSVSINSDRNEAVITIPDFDTDIYVLPPEGATHFRLINAIAVLSNFAYDASVKRYEALVPGQNEMSNWVFSSEIPIGSMVGSDTVLTAALTGSPVLDANAGLLVAFGIEFVQEINGNYFVLASNNALRIVQVA